MTFYYNQTSYPLTPRGELVVYQYLDKGSVPFWGAYYTTGDSGFAREFRKMLTRKPSKRQIQNWIDSLSR